MKEAIMCDGQSNQHPSQHPLSIAADNYHSSMVTVYHLLMATVCRMMPPPRGKVSNWFHEVRELQCSPQSADGNPVEAL